MGRETNLFGVKKMQIFGQNVTCVFGLAEVGRVSKVLQGFLRRWGVLGCLWLRLRLWLVEGVEGVLYGGNTIDQSLTISSSTMVNQDSISLLLNRFSLVFIISQFSYLVMSLINDLLVSLGVKLISSNSFKTPGYKLPSPNPPNFRTWVFWFGNIIIVVSEYRVL